MNKIVLSLDYELFFGTKCGSVDSCLITPTRKILDALRVVGGCAVFFIDYLMLKRMHEECDETRRLAEKIEEQIKGILRAGSRIELHLHPHWVDAKYIGNGEWDFSDYSHYCLQSLSKSEVKRMFEEGTCYLNALARQVVPDYKVVAFRAGGWAVLPFEHLKDGFEVSGIKVDSSVCNGMVLNGINYRMDFAASPEFDSYRFSDDVLVPDTNGQFLEVPISSFNYNPVSYMLNGFDHKLNCRKYRHYALGSYMSNGKKPKYKPAPLLKRLFTKSLFGIDTVSKFTLLFHLVLAKRAMTVLMGHPKDLNDAALANIAFLGRHVKFVTYDDLICKELER